MTAAQWGGFRYVLGGFISAPFLGTFDLFRRGLKPTETHQVVHHPWFISYMTLQCVVGFAVRLMGKNGVELDEFIVLKAFL